MYLPPAPFAPAWQARQEPRNTASAGSVPHFSQQHPAPVRAAPRTRRQLQPRIPPIDDNAFHDILSRRFVSSRFIANLQNRADNTPLQNTNLTIGIVVGVVLALFFIGLGVFLWFFRNSIRLSKRKKNRRRRKSSGSKSSKSSGGSRDGPPPPPPPPPG